MGAFSPCQASQAFVADAPWATKRRDGRTPVLPKPPATLTERRAHSVGRKSSNESVVPLCRRGIYASRRGNADKSVLRKTIEPVQAREGRKACLPGGGYRSWLFSLGVDKDAIRCPAACTDEHHQTKIVSDRSDLRDTCHKPSAALTPWMQRDVHCPASPRMALSRVARADCYFLKPRPGQARFRKYLDIGILEGEGIQN
jgi:hypothetical protein